MQNKEQVFLGVQKVIGESIDKYPLERKEYKNTSKASYNDIFTQVKRAINLTKNGIYTDEVRHSIFIYGPTGTGKTQIIKQIAENTDCVYHKLEIQKVPIEELQGFPYLFNSKDGNTYVRLAQPTVLPPSDDKRLWILHLDEFNKAETENMAAVMNLILDGEIGGSADYDETTGKSLKYKLPEKTVIIGTGNKKTQKNVSSFNTVNRYDIATAERWHRNLFLEYNAFDWIESYAGKPFNFFGYELPTRILGIILQFILDKAMEENPESPFIIPKLLDKKDSKDFSGDSTFSPRAWTLISDNMLFDMWQDWKNILRKDQRPDFIYYANNPNNQIKALYDNVYELGINGESLAKDIEARFRYFIENRVTPYDIINDYVPFRNNIVNMKNKKGAVLYLLIGVAQALKEYEELDVSKTALHISTFITDADIQVEDISAFLFEIDKSKDQLSKDISDMLYSINERYKNAYEGYFYTSEKDLLNAKAN